MAQEISGCDVTSHYSLSPGVGRGATEIDIVEVTPRGPPPLSLTSLSFSLPPPGRSRSSCP